MSTEVWHRKPGSPCSVYDENGLLVAAVVSADDADIIERAPQLRRQVEVLCEHLADACSNYSDLLSKYGLTHHWGMISVQSWQKALNDARAAVAGVAPAPAYDATATNTDQHGAQVEAIAKGSQS